jgi:hypothetical protein
MSTSLRRRTAAVVLALSVLGGGAVLVANTTLLSPTADGGLPGPIIIPGKSTITRSTIDLTK